MKDVWKRPSCTAVPVHLNIAAARIGIDDFDTEPRKSSLPVHRRRGLPSVWYTK
jgi:hypothetical protein